MARGKTVNTILDLRDRFSSKMKQVAEQTKKNGRQMNLLNNQINTFKRSAVSGFTTAAKQTALLTASITGVTAAMATVQSGVQFIQEYSESMYNLQAATGATSEEVAQMNEQIKDLYMNNMGSSWSDLSNAMMTAKQVTGQMGEELKQTTSLAVTYRDTFGEDISQSIKAADTMMKNFGITSTEAYNLLAQGAHKNLNKSDELIDSANEYATYFKTLGFNANEMFDLFSAGLEKGAFNLDKVGDAVKEFGIRVKDDSKGTNEAFAGLGLNAAKMSQTFARGGSEAKKAFNQVVDAIGRIKDPVKQNTISVQLFGTTFEDLEKNVILALGTAKSQFDMTRNTMEEINKVKYDNPTQAIKGIGRLVETSLFIPIADRLLPKLSEFGQWFKDHTPEIEAAIDKAFTTGGKVIDGFKDSIAWAKSNTKTLIPVVTGLTAAITAQKVIGVVSGLYKTWTKVTKGLTAAQIALNLITKASPFGWIATAIGLVVAAGVALWQNWDTVKAKASELWQWLEEIWNNVRAATVNAFNGIGDKVRGAFESVVGFIKRPINSVIHMINTVIDGLNSISFDVPDWLPDWAGGGQTFGISLSKIPQFALGTSYFSGGLARINERGGEIVNLPNGSQVIPADKSKQMVESSNKQPIIQIIIQGNVIGEEEEVNRLLNRAIPRLMAVMGNVY